jgi:ribosomal protein S12 methylthiotransferase
MEESRFDRVGVFTYSREEDTPAWSLPGHVAEKDKKRRFRAAYRLQQKISHQINASRIGQVLRVLVDEPIPGSEQAGAGAVTALVGPDAEAGIGRSVVKFPPGARFLGRTEADAPEIDGTVFIQGSDAVPGEFRSVRVTGAHPYDLVGVLA